MSKLASAEAWNKKDSTNNETNNIKKNPNGVLFIVALTILVFGVITVRLASIQLFNFDELFIAAQSNRVREFVIYAPRGKILDRNGKVLADNTSRFQLSVVPYLLPTDADAREQLISSVASALGVKTSEISQKVAEVGTDDPRPQFIFDVFDNDSARKLRVAISNLTAFRLDSIPSREYIKTGSLSHVVGYVGRVDERDLQRDDAAILFRTDFIGKAGVEQQYDSELRGEHGRLWVEVDALGRPVKTLRRVAPVAGKDLKLSIDLDVQTVLAAKLKTQMKAAKSSRSSAVATNTVTGEIIALVSYPTYDNNMFSAGITTAQLSKLIKDKNEPLYNKVTAGGYPTGSVIKPIVAVAALEEKVVTPDTVIVDRGYISVNGFRFNGWRLSGLGPMNIRSAIAWSSNIYFFTVGGGYGSIAGLGNVKLADYYHRFGLGELPGLGIRGETAGRVPDDKWKKLISGEPWYVGDTYNISIGQGDLVVSPLQMSLAHSAIANGGNLLVPTLLKTDTPKIKRVLDISARSFEVVREGMRQTLTNGLTCDCLFKDVSVKVAGKSGTAETDKDNGQPPHAWFTAFAPYEKPELQVTVLIEEGFYGTLYGAPVAAAAMAEYFD